MGTAGQNRRDGDVTRHADADAALREERARRERARRAAQRMAAQRASLVVREEEERRTRQQAMIARRQAWENAAIQRSKVTSAVDVERVLAARRSDVAKKLLASKKGLSEFGNLEQRLHERTPTWPGVNVHTEDALSPSSPTLASPQSPAQRSPDLESAAIPLGRAVALGRAAPSIRRATPAAPAFAEGVGATSAA